MPVVGLVEHEEIRIVDQRAAEAELLVHAARELSGRAIAEGREPRGLEQLRDPRLARRARVAEEPAEEVRVLEDGERRVEVAAESLRHVGDARRHGRAEPARRHVAAERLDGARLDRARARDEPEQRGLPDTVGTDQAHDAAGGHVEIHAVEGSRLAVAMRHGPEPRGEGGRRAHSGNLTFSDAGHFGRPGPMRR